MRATDVPLLPCAFFALVCATAAAEPIPTLRCIPLVQSEDVYYAADFSPDGKLVACADYHGTVHVWDVSSAREVRRFVPQVRPNGLQGYGAITRFSPDGGTLAAIINGKAVLRDFESGVVRRNLEGRKGDLISLAFSEDGAHVAGSSDGGYVHLWDRTTGALKVSLPTVIGGGVVAFSPDSRTLAFASVEEGVVGFWNVRTMRRETYRKMSEHRICGLVYSRDGEVLIAANRHGAVFVWNVVESRVERILPLTLSGEYTIALSPDRRLLANVDYEPANQELPRRFTVQFVDAESGKRLWSFVVDSKGPTSVAFSPDGCAVVTTSYEGSVKLWTFD